MQVHQGLLRFSLDEDLSPDKSDASVMALASDRECGDTLAGDGLSPNHKTRMISTQKL